MKQTLISHLSPVIAQPSSKRRLLSKSKVIKWKKDYKWKKTIKKPSRKRVEVHQIRVDVASYPEFQSLLKNYVTQKAVPVSFNVSGDLDSESYGKIVKDLLDSNSKEFRRDKIERPRDHSPKPKIECRTLEEIKKVYGVMGRFWSPRICLPPNDGSPEINKLYAEISEFIKYVGLHPFLIPLDSIAHSPQQ